MPNNLVISSNISSGLSSISSQLSSCLDDLNRRMPDVLDRATMERKISLHKTFSDSIHVKLNNIHSLRKSRGYYE